MRGRHVFLDSLRLHGVTKIFGNPGTTETPMLDTLIDYPDIDYIMHLHEGVAVGAANLYAQASNSTGVANMHVAPGLGNAIGMIYGGLKNSSPMVITAGAQDTRIRLRGPLLGHDLVAMAKPVVKWSIQVEHADEMAMIMARAFKIAHEHPQGPVFVALPINVMEEETENAAYHAGKLSMEGNASDSHLQQVAELINAASNPVIVAGDDVVRDEARDTLVALSEKAGIGVHLELITARFAFPSDHDHFRNKLGPDYTAINGSLGDHDLVILIGGAFFEEVWYSPDSPFADNARVIQLESSPSRLAENIGVDIGIAGQLADSLSRLTSLVNDAPDRRELLSQLKQAENDAANEKFCLYAAAFASRKGVSTCDVDAPMIKLGGFGGCPDKQPTNTKLTPYMEGGKAHKGLCGLPGGAFPSTSMPDFRPGCQTDFSRYDSILGSGLRVRVSKIY